MDKDKTTALTFKEEWDAMESQLSAATNENEKLREALKGIKNIDDIDDEAWMIAHAALTPNNEQNNIK